MNPITMMAIGAGTGLLKSELIDRPKEGRQRALAAETARMSPWTGLKPEPIQEADPFGSAIQGGMSGASFGQNMEDQASKKQLMEAQTSWLNRGGAPQYTAATSVAPSYGSPWKLGNFQY